MDDITFPVYPYNTNGLSILFHGVILLPDATSYDKHVYKTAVYWDNYITNLKCIFQKLCFRT